MDRKAWTYVFDALQRIAACVHKIEGDVPGQEPQTLGFAEIGKWVTENMARYLPKGVSPVRMSKRDSLFSAGVGDVPRAPAREDSKLSKDPSEKEEEPSSPVRMPSMTEEDEKDTHIQKIHSFGIKTATAPAAEHKREDHALPGDVASPLKLVPPGKNWVIKQHRCEHQLLQTEQQPVFKAGGLVAAAGPQEGPDCRKSQVDPPRWQPSWRD